MPVGATVTFVGAGRNPHNAVASDGSWSTESEFGSLEQSKARWHRSASTAGGVHVLLHVSRHLRGGRDGGTPSGRRRQRVGGSAGNRRIDLSPRLERRDGEGARGPSDHSGRGGRRESGRPRPRRARHISGSGGDRQTGSRSSRDRSQRGRDRCRLRSGERHRRLRRRGGGREPDRDERDRQRSLLVGHQGLPGVVRHGHRQR